MFCKLRLVFIFVFGVKCDFSEDDIAEIVYLDTTIDPCDDFYQFSCGNFKNIYPRASNVQLVDHFTLLQSDLIQVGQEILQIPRTPDVPEALNKAKAAFKGCMNPDLHTAPELRTIKEVGGFPLISSDTPESQFSWNEIGNLVAKYGVPLIFTFTVGQTEQNESAIYIGSDTLSNPSFFMPNHPDKVSYEEALEEGFQEMGQRRKKRDAELAPFDVFLQTVSLYLRDQAGGNKTDEEVIEEIEKMATFMRQLYAGGIVDKTVLALVESPASPQKLQNWTDEQFGEKSPINWHEYMGRVFQMTNVDLNENTKILFQSMQRIYGIVNLVNQTDPKVLKNFALLRIFLFQAPDSDTTIRTAFENYYNSQGYTLYERSLYCTRKILDVAETAGLSYAVAYAYKQYHYNINKITKAYEMIYNVTNTFKEDIRSADWLDEQSRSVATLKANNILTLLAYPDFVENGYNLDTFYENIPICEWDTYGNARNIRAFRQAYQFNQLRNSPRDFWGKSTFEPNAYYNRPNNKIVIPIAMLNPVFFYGDNYLLDYSRLGSVIGHEITHGFDENGKNYDQDGLLNSWWSADTMAAFQDRSQCFRNQYSQYYVPEIGAMINGNSTINENLADSGGIRMSFNSFKKLAVKENFKATGQYTLEQLFFISYGTMWCGEESNNYLKALTSASNMYPPKKYRVIGSLSNMEEFAEAFQCPVGSTMNPENKCILW